MPRVKSIATLRRELAAKEKQLNKLVAQRNKLADKLAAVDKQIAAMGGEAPAGPVRRKRRKGAKPGPKPGRKAAKKAAKKKTRKAAKKAGRRRRATGTPLVDCLRQVLAKAGEPMRAKDIMTAVTKAGYKSGAKNFYGIVAAALRDDKVFKRVARGVYTVK